MSTIIHNLKRMTLLQLLSEFADNQSTYVSLTDRGTWQEIYLIGKLINHFTASSQR